MKAMSPEAREARIHFDLHRAISNVIEKKKEFDGIEFERAEPEYPIKGVGRADLVLFDRTGRVWLVIETKSSLAANDPYDPKVIDQALRYASWLGAYYFATCDGKTFVIFDNKERGVSFWERKRVPPYDLRREINLEEFVQKVLQDIVNLERGVKAWSQLDEAFVHRLKALHERLIPLLYESVENAVDTDSVFKRDYEKWLDEQGWKIETAINEKIAVEAAYILINKILFYKVLETKYSKLPKLRKIEQLFEKGVEHLFRQRLEECFKEALKIDYQAVFKPGIYDRIPLPVGVVQRLNEFLNEASEYDLDKIESDIVGRIYEGLIPRDERRRLGQYYTPPAICDLIVKMCVKNADDLILDPGCGSGGFLIKAYYRLLELSGKEPDEEIHQKILRQLWGIDISQFPAHLCVINLALRKLEAKSDVINVIPSDFFNVLSKQSTLKPIETAAIGEKKGIYELLPQFDAVVCNPPYTRQDDIGDEKYREYIRKIALSFDGKIDISSEAGIYAYFFTHSAHFLEQGGMFGYIVSNSWMDVRFGIEIQRFFLDNFKINCIIEFDRRAFAEAAINTVIMIAQKLSSREHEKDRNENYTKFVRIKSALTTEEMIKRVEDATESYEDNQIRVMLKKQSELYEDTKWLKYLRAPPIYFKIVRNKKITTLGKIAKVNVGIITYANDFFILSQEQLNQRGIEKKYLRPILTSPKDLSFLDVDLRDVKNYLFYADFPRSKLKETQALEYINWGETTPVEITRGATKGTVVKGFQNIPSFKNRSKEMWYSIGKRLPSPILVPRLIWERIFVAWNRVGAFSNDRFYEISPNRLKDSSTLLSLLNTSLSAMIIEVTGRTTLGEGGLELMKYELDNMPIIHPQTFSRSEKDKIEKLYLELCKAMRSNDKDRESEVRRQLDTVIFDSLELTPQERDSVLKAFEELQQMRKQRVEVEVMIEHPETRRKVTRVRERKIKEFIPKGETMTKWL